MSVVFYAGSILRLQSQGSFVSPPTFNKKWSCVILQKKLIIQPWPFRQKALWRTFSAPLFTLFMKQNGFLHLSVFRRSRAEVVTSSFLFFCVREHETILRTAGSPEIMFLVIARIEPWTARSRINPWTPLNRLYIKCLTKQKMCTIHTPLVL